MPSFAVPFGSREVAPGCGGWPFFARMGPETAYAVDLLPALVVTGLGVGAIFGSVQNAARNPVFADAVAVASSPVNSARQIGMLRPVWRPARLVLQAI